MSGLFSFDLLCVMMFMCVMESTYLLSSLIFLTWVCGLSYIRHEGLDIRCKLTSIPAKAFKNQLIRLQSEDV
jgi:hypothetical protein